MRFKHISDSKETWWVPLVIPAKEMHDLLTSFDRSRYLEFEIEVHVEVTPTVEGKIFEYANEWALPSVGNYPGRIIEAIDKHMARIRVEEKVKEALRSQPLTR